MTKMVAVALDLPAELHEAACRYAEAENCATSEVVAAALATYLANAPIVGQMTLDEAWGR